jgi:hypothetical protein
LSAATVPLYRSASYGGTTYGNTTDTNNNFVSGDYNETGTASGLTGNASTKFLNTGFPANTNTAAGTHFGIMLLATQAISGDRSTIGTYSSTNTITWGLDITRPFGTTNEPGSRNCYQGAYSPSSTAFGERAGDAPVSPGNVFINAGAYYRNGVAYGTTGTTSNYPSAHNVYVMALNNGNGSGSPAVNHTSARLGGYSIGANMSAAQAASYHHAITAFNAALSRT